MEVLFQAFGIREYVLALMATIPIKNVKRIHFAYLTSYDVRDAHHVVINYICKMISGKTIIFQNYLVIYYAILKTHFTVNHVFELNVSRIRNFHSENV